MCGLLSGSTIKPGETYSVNDTAGPPYAGKWMAEKQKGIENGVYTDQAGGGICQVINNAVQCVAESGCRDCFA